MLAIVSGKTARFLRAVFLASLSGAFVFAAVSSIAQTKAETPPVASPATPSSEPKASSVPPSGTSNSRGNNGKTKAAAMPVKPLWASLTPAQQSALSPLAAEWDHLGAVHKAKWLKIANSFPSMKPEAQSRLQERMRVWAALTPEQRRVARESFSRAKRLNPNEKSAQWQQYQQLPDDQKKKLADEASGKKRVTALPAPSQNKHVAPPPKSALRSGLDKHGQASRPASAVNAGVPPKPVAKAPPQAPPTEPAGAIIESPR